MAAGGGSWVKVGRVGRGGGASEVRGGRGSGKGGGGGEAGGGPGVEGRGWARRARGWLKILLGGGRRHTSASIVALPFYFLYKINSTCL